jgi:hypothetical protein
MKARIKGSSEPKTIDVGRYVSITISDVPTATMCRDLVDELNKQIPKIVAKVGGQLTIEETSEKDED